MDGWVAWMLSGFYVTVWIASLRNSLDGESRARQTSLRLLFVSGASASVLLQDALSITSSVLLATLALAGLLMDDKHRAPVDGVRPPFDFFLRCAVGQCVILAGAGFLFARTGTFDLGGWQARLMSAQTLPGVGAAFLLIVMGFWILAGAWPSAGWQGDGWVDSPAVVPERVWFSRLMLFLAIHTVQHVAVSPAGLSALRLWDATRWAAWAAFAVCTLACLSSTHCGKRWGLLDAGGLFLIWAFSDAPLSVVAALAASQALALSLGAMAPPSERSAGIWLVKLTSAFFLPGWWILSVSGGEVVSKGAAWVWFALLWFTFVILRTASPLPSEEAASAESEKGFLMQLGAALAGFGLLFLLQ